MSRSGSWFVDVHRLVARIASALRHSLWAAGFGVKKRTTSPADDLRSALCGPSDPSPSSRFGTTPEQ